MNLIARCYQENLLNCKEVTVMYRKDQAKLYYLYMLSDGEASDNEKKLFTTICKELSIYADEKKSIIKECKNIPFDNIFDEIKGLAGEPVEEKNDIYKLAVALSMFGNADDYASILWNLINLGYADIKYTYEEREIVDFLRNHWKITEDLYQEMIDVAETCLALEEHKKWVESLEDSSYKDEKMKQIKKDIKSAQDGIKITLAELKF
jgi:hypothetical protein